MCTSVCVCQTFCCVVWQFSIGVVSFLPMSKTRLSWYLLLVWMCNGNIVHFRFVGCFRKNVLIQAYKSSGTQIWRQLPLCWNLNYTIQFWRQNTVNVTHTHTFACHPAIKTIESIYCSHLCCMFVHMHGDIFSYSAESQKKLCHVHKSFTDLVICVECLHIFFCLVHPIR